MNYENDSAALSEIIDTEVIKTHFPRDNNNKMLSFAIRDIKNLYTIIYII